MEGVCQPWVTPADLGPEADGTDAVKLEACQVASEVLYAASARRWPGECTSTVRPCTACSCWQVLEHSGHVIGPDTMSWPGPGPWLFDREWRSPYGTCGCGPIAAVQLPGPPPFVSIESVMIGAEPVPSTAYRLDDDLLIRLDGALWPSCQDLTAPCGEGAAFCVTYVHGSGPPVTGEAAARELATQLSLALAGSPLCQLPRGVTRLVRQGVTIDKATTSMFARGGRSGLVLVDLFVDTFNPLRSPSESTVWSPDLPPPARRA